MKIASALNTYGKNVFREVRVRCPQCKGTHVTNMQCDTGDHWFDCGICGSKTKHKVSEVAPSRRTRFDDPNKIVGYEVDIEFAYNSGKPAETKHWLGSEAACRRKAHLCRHFRCVRETRPVTADGWRMAYGYGPM